MASCKWEISAIDIKTASLQRNKITRNVVNKPTYEARTNKQEYDAGLFYYFKDTNLVVSWFASQINFYG